MSIYYLVKYNSYSIIEFSFGRCGIPIREEVNPVIPRQKILSVKLTKIYNIIKLMQNNFNL
jgi:hypothetical protein